MDTGDDAMTTPEARYRRFLSSGAMLLFIFFVLTIMAETYRNAVHHGASQTDRYDLRSDLEYNRGIIIEQRREIDALKAEAVEMHAELDRLRAKFDGVPK
jgi:hypothetical protein